MYNIIDSFRGEYRFLSNFYDSPIEECETNHSGIPSGFIDKFKNVEQFYHYKKALFFGDMKTAGQIYQTPNPSENKKLGRKVKNFDKKAWTQVSIKVMNSGLIYKFEQNENLRDRLLNTYQSILIEGNNWGDRFWGMVNGEGQNWLGILLMKIRNQLIINK